MILIIKKLYLKIVFFEVKLEVQGGNPVLKKKPLAKLIQIKEKINLL